MEQVLGSRTEVRALKDEIAGLRSDLRRFIERANQQHVDTAITDLKTNYSELFADHETTAARTDLSTRMVKDCAMRDACFTLFMEFLHNVARHIKDGSVSDEVISSYRDQMKVLRKKGPYSKCDTCFSEVHRLFEKQVDLMQSLGIYQKSGGDDASSKHVPDETAVRDLLDPVANIQRFQMLKALMIQTRTFSDLSHMTGLRGGNLLFHIKKLVDAGMILQRHERGDYIITDKGFKTMTAIASLHRLLNPE